MKALVYLVLAWCSTAIAYEVPGTCFPVRGVALPDPRQDEPFIATGIVQLTSSAGFGNDYSVQIYRRGCAGGGAALLIRFDALGIPVGEAPRISVVQGSTSISDVRYTTEPYVSWERVNRREDFDLGRVVTLSSPAVDHTVAMTIQIVGRTTLTIEVPDFDPAIYPDVLESLPITGYVSGSYYNPLRSGEGMLVELDPREIIGVAWYTYSDDGSPLWLAGAGNVCVDLGDDGAPLPNEKATCVSPPTITEVELRAFSGGGFAGAFDPAGVESKVWGNVRLEWIDCATVEITLFPTHESPELPMAEGVLTWRRLTSVQHARC